MPTSRRRNLIRMHKDVISKKKENNSESVKSTGKHTRTRTISADALKTKFKNGEMPSK